MGDQEILDICREGDSVIVDVNGDRQSLVKLKKGGSIKVGKGYCSMDTLIGEKFGSFWELDRNILRKRKRVCETAGEDWGSVLEVEKNNSQLKDGGKVNQALTAEDIAQLKAEGKTGDEIIDALTQNSATFQNKTQYSQNKYMKKKAKKYLTHATLVRPTARSLTEFYFNKMPQKIGGLRCDSLAILLSLANISACSRTLVVDSVGGLVTGAVVERMGGEGAVVNAYIGDKKPAQEIAGSFNFPATYSKPTPASLAELTGYLTGDEKPDTSNDAQPDKDKQIGQDQADDKTQAANGEEGKKVDTAEKLNATANGSEQPVSNDGALPDQADVEMETAEPIHPDSHAEENPNAASTSISTVEQSNSQAVAKDGPRENGVGSAEQQEQIEAEKKAKREARRQRLQTLCQQGFQSCILACPNADPSALMTLAIPLLAASASFSVFFPSIGPLAECMETLKASKAAINMQLQESWWREYQVLPGRTHPTMTTSGTGGYILSGTRVINE